MGEDDNHPLIRQIRARAKAQVSAATVSQNKPTKRKRGRPRKAVKAQAKGDLYSFDRDQKKATDYLKHAKLVTPIDKRNRRIVKLAELVHSLSNGQNVQNRTLQTWLTADEFALIDEQWEQQKRIRAGSQNKPQILKDYEAEFKRAQLHHAKAQSFQRANNLTAAEASRDRCRNTLRELFNFVQSQVQTDSSLINWFDRAFPENVDEVTFENMPRGVTSSSKDNRVKKMSKPEVKLSVVREALSQLLKGDDYV